MPTIDETQPKTLSMQRAIGEAIVQRREQICLSQLELAHLSCLSPAQVCQAEGGLLPLSLPLLMSFAFALEMPLWRLLQFAEQGMYQDGDI